MSVPGLYDPSPVQLEAHSFQPTPRVEILYGGAGGGGKTYWLRHDPFETQWAHEHQRWEAARRMGETFKSTGWALHTRRESPELLQSLLYVKEFSEKIDPGVHWDGNNNLLTFSCGYRYQFGHIQHEEDWRRYGSQDYTWLGLDEAIETLWAQFNGLRLRVRSADPYLGKHLRICLASNPDAPFEGKWVKERYVDPAPAGRQVMQATHTLSDGTTETISRIYIPAYLRDNPDEEFRRSYEVQLRDMPHHIMRARLFADWNTVEGAFFEYEWIPETHVVAPFKIPDHWPIGRVMDWGYKSPCPILYYARDEEDNIIVIDELNFNFKVREQDRKDAELVAIGIKNYEKEHGYWDKKNDCSRVTGVADYQIAEQRGFVGPTIAQTMASYGIYWYACKKDRFAATAELLRRLKDIPKSKNSRPGLTVFNTCTETVRTVPLVQRVKDTDERGKTQEVPKDGGEDHWLDCLFYICLFRGAAADKDGKTLDEEDDFDDLQRARMRQNQRRWGYGL
jgi:hypothetical protein